MNGKVVESQLTAREKSVLAAYRRLLRRGGTPTAGDILAEMDLTPARGCDIIARLASFGLLPGAVGAQTRPPVTPPARPRQSPRPGHRTGRPPKRAAVR